MRYPYLLFDADNTLFDFDRAEVVAFAASCAAAGLEPSDEYERGVILRQDPAAYNYRKGTGLEILVWVSSGEETGVMPDVVNQTLSVAERLTLKELAEKFDLTIEAPEEARVFSAEVPAGYIISSTPRKGETIHKGDVISLVVSKGNQTWPLYSFVGLNYFTEVDEVNRHLDEQNMELGGITPIYNDEPFGTILSQTPAANTAVAEGTKVSFVVSQGPEPQPEPEAPPPDLTLHVVIPLYGDLPGRTAPPKRTGGLYLRKLHPDHHRTGGYGDRRHPGRGGAVP